MKKIYLFSILFMGAVASSIGQTCPPTPVAWQNTFSDPFEHCAISFTHSALVGQSHWQIGLLNEDGDYIPQYGTGIPSNPTPDYWVDLNPATGGATFYYDCFDPNFIDIKWVELRYAEEDHVIITCQIIPTPGAPTPVKLTSFTGRLQNDNNVVLDWATAIELDSYKYEIERSADGLHFTKVGDINAAGNSQTTVRYTFNDQLPTAGAYFYRLKQIDFNGTFENSKVVYVNSKKGAGVITKLFPNPTKGEIQLVGATSADLSPNNLSIFSIAGQRVKYNVVGANAISLDATAPDGVYILKLKTAAGLQQFKVVKNQSAGH